LSRALPKIDGGEIIAYSGNYDFYERERTIRETNQQAAFVRQQAMLAKEQRFLERFKAHAAKPLKFKAASRPWTRSNFRKSKRS
jgi:ATPase subunit of ABC transporter with duplicated ATPase domains